MPRPDWSYQIDTYPVLSPNHDNTDVPVAPAPVPRLPSSSAKKSAVTLSLLRLSSNTGPVYEGLAKYAANIVSKEAWPAEDMLLIEGRAVDGIDPALHDGAHE